MQEQDRGAWQKRAGDVSEAGGLNKGMRQDLERVDGEWQVSKCKSQDIGNGVWNGTSIGYG